jgi:hypothetical protein
VRYGKRRRRGPGIRKLQQEIPRVAGPIKNYDPKSIRMTFNGVEIQGFAEGFTDLGDGSYDVLLPHIPTPQLTAHGHGTIQITLLGMSPPGPLRDRNGNPIGHYWVFDHLDQLP